MQLIYPIYQDCKEFGGLALKPIECVLVPLCEYTNEIQNKIKKWIADNLPLWSSFKVEPCAKLLGIYIGPAAGSKMWNGVVAKYNNRILELKRCQAPLAINCLTYNSRIAPVFSYVSQLVPLPKSFEERFGIFSVLRVLNV